MARSSDLPFPLSIIGDSTFQAREIRRVMGLSLLYLAVTTALVGLFYDRLLDSLLEGAVPLLFVSEDMAPAADAVPALGEVLGRWLLAMLVINVLVTVALGIFVTRRLGQPLMAIKRALREVARGNLDVRLRASDADEFGEIAAELIDAVDSVRERLAEAKSAMERAANAGDEATASGSALAECRDALEWFQVERAPHGDDPWSGRDASDDADGARAVGA